MTADTPPEFALFLKDFDERAAEVRAGMAAMAERIRAVYDLSVAAVDRARVRRMQDHVREVMIPRWIADPAGLPLRAMPHKYFDLPLTLRDKARWVVAARLDRGPPQRVLDIGVGGGAFAFQVQCCGHEVVAIDIEDEAFTHQLEALGLHRIVQEVAPFRPLEVEGAFDVVTGVQITFNRLNPLGELDGHFWTKADWRWFLTELAGRLKRPGRIFLALNRHAIRGRESSDADRVMEWLEAWGAQVSPFQHSAMFELDDPQVVSRRAKRVLNVLKVDAD